MKFDTMACEDGAQEKAGFPEAEEVKRETRLLHVFTR